MNGFVINNIFTTIDNRVIRRNWKMRAIIEVGTVNILNLNNPNFEFSFVNLVSTTV